MVCNVCNGSGKVTKRFLWIFKYKADCIGCEGYGEVPPFQKAPFHAQPEFRRRHVEVLTATPLPDDDDGDIIIGAVVAAVMNSDFFTNQSVQAESEIQEAQAEDNVTPDQDAENSQDGNSDSFDPGSNDDSSCCSNEGS